MAKSAEEVEKQLKNMISFIIAEAEEKAKEINVRAEEEFNIEKTSIVQDEKKRINEEFAQRMKLVEVQKKMYEFILSFSFLYLFYLFFIYFFLFYFFFIFFYFF